LKRQELFGLMSSEVADDAQRQMAFERFKSLEKKVVLAGCKSWSTADMMPLKKLGEGSFGKVYLVKHKDTDQHFALKKMQKSVYNKKNLRSRMFAEREILGQASCRWFVDLIATFQDADHIYVLMEFLQGGDLMYWLTIRRRFTEEESRFYLAELLEGIDVVHKCGYVHRDIKPDNAVLCVSGHLKLLDFGLCKLDPTALQAGRDPSENGCDSMAREAEGTQASRTLTRRDMAKSLCGTPGYLAPEAFDGVVSTALDIWALGHMTYEFLYGAPAFHAGELVNSPQALHVINTQVRSWATVVPMKLQKAQRRGLLSPVAADFISKVLCHHEGRLKADQIRAHPFFASVDFTRLHEMRPPIVPAGLSGPADTKYFDAAGEVEASWRANQNTTTMKDLDIEWAGYEFDKETRDLQSPEAVRKLFQE